MQYIFGFLNKISCYKLLSMLLQDVRRCFTPHVIIHSTRIYNVRSEVPSTILGCWRYSNTCDQREPWTQGASVPARGAGKGQGHKLGIMEVL